LVKAIRMAASAEGLTAAGPLIRFSNRRARPFTNAEKPVESARNEQIVRGGSGPARSHAVASKREQVMTIDELAAYLKVAKSTLYKLAQEGRVPGQKVGKHWRFRKDAIDRWLENADGTGSSRQ
jgi:excisionase family DNA binding protein